MLYHVVNNKFYFNQIKNLVPNEKELNLRLENKKNNCLEMKKQLEILERENRTIEREIHKAQKENEEFLKIINKKKNHNTSSSSLRDVYKEEIEKYNNIMDKLYQDYNEQELNLSKKLKEQEKIVDSHLREIEVLSIYRQGIIEKLENDKKQLDVELNQGKYYQMTSLHNIKKEFEEKIKIERRLSEIKIKNCLKKTKKKINEEIINNWNEIQEENVKLRQEIQILATTLQNASDDRNTIRKQNIKLGKYNTLKRVEWIKSPT